MSKHKQGQPIPGHARPGNGAGQGNMPVHVGPGPEAEQGTIPEAEVRYHTQSPTIPGPVTEQGTITRRFKLSKLSIILLGMGVLLCISPVAGNMYTRYQEEKLLEEWLNSVEADPSDLMEADLEAAYSQLMEAFGSEASEMGESQADGTGISGDGAEDSLGADSNGTGGGAGGTGGGNSASTSGTAISEQKVLGVIQIAKIKLKEPIVEGVNKSNLRSGIGHVPGTAALGQQGNCALAGHRNYTYKKFFRKLDELVPGDEITISTKKEDLIYTVTGKSVVTPEDVSVLRGSKDDNILTLITCTPVYVASHRLIVTAELTERVLREP